MSSEFEEDGPDQTAGEDPQALDRLKKAPHAYRTISEVADELHVPQHVLRFWETRFPEVRPLKRGGGRRYYRPEDIDVLRRISELLYVQGYTIKGVQRVLREGEGTSLAVPAPPEASAHVPDAADRIDGEAEDGGDPAADLMPGPTPAASDANVAEPFTAPALEGALTADLERVRHDVELLRAERLALRVSLRDILDELQAIRATLPS